MSALVVALVAPLAGAHAATTTGRLLVENVAPSNPGPVLDVGAGSGETVTLTQTGNGTTVGVGVDLTFTRGTSTFTAKVHPAVGSTLTAGDTYTASTVTGISSANLPIGAPGYFFFTGCSTLSAHIDGVQRDGGGVITGIAASFKSTCSATSYTWGSVQAGMSVPVGFTQTALNAGALGNVPVGVDTTKTVTVSSTGSAPVHLGTPVRTGTAPELTITDDTCANATIAAGSSCTLVVHANPTTTTALSATLTYPADDFAGEFVLAISAAGKNLPLAPTAQAFAASNGVGVLIAPATQGTDNAAVTGWKVTDVTGTPTVVATLPLGTTSWSTTGLSSGSSHTYTVAATSAVGDSAASAPVSAVVLGAQATAGSLDAITMQHGYTSFVTPGPQVGSVSLTSFTLSAPVAGGGTNWITIPSIRNGARLVPGHYTGAGTPQIDAPAGGCTTDDLLVTDADFAADGTPQVFTATYSNTCGDGSIAAGEIRWNSTSGYRGAIATPRLPDLGNVGVAVASPTTPIVVSNEGTLPLTFATAAFTGTQADQFHLVSDTCSGQVVAAGATCTLGVSVTATAAGALSTFLTLDDDGVGTGQSVYITATASDLPGAPNTPNAAAVVKRVVVTWSYPQTGGGPTGYLVYRGPAGGSLGTTPIATLGDVHTWTDRTVSAGQSWFYGIRATNAAGTGDVATTAAVTVPSEGLAYSVDDGAGNYDIAVGSPTGDASVPLVQDGHDSYDPAVSPDGTRVAYASDRGDNVGIWVVPIDGLTAPVQITGAAGNADFNPAWSPDGKTIAFDRQSYAGGDSSIYTVAATASGVPQYVYGGQSAENPSYTPSGRELVVGLTTGTHGVAVLNPSTGTRRVLAGTAGGRSPQVSPDGTRIVFSVVDGTTTDSCNEVYPRTHLATVGYVGGAVSAVTATGNWIDDPTWWKGAAKVSADVSTVSGGCLDRSILKTWTTAGADVSTAAPGDDAVFPAAVAQGGIARIATPPAAPTKLVAHVTGASTVTVGWTKPSATDLYEYVVVRSPAGWYRAPNNLGEGTIVYRGLATSVKLTGLSAGRQYGVAVFAVDTAGSMSPRASVLMTPTGPPKVSLKLSKSSVKLGKTVTFSGTVAPKMAGQKGSLQRLVKGKWKTVKALTISSASTFSVKWKTSSRTDYKWRVYLPASDAHPATQSPSKKLTVK